MFEKLHKHSKDHNLYPVFQSAYRREHSTETALLRVVDDILHNMNRQHVTIFEFSFEHLETPWTRPLDMSFGITGTALQWLRSYLSGHSQHVIVNGEQSESLDLPFGVPQGSCLGPLLFTLNSSKFFHVTKTSFTCSACIH